MALTKAVESVIDWTAVAQNTLAESTVLDCSGDYLTELCLQAFLDTTTAHTGTKFKVQVSSNSSGDEDWHDYSGAEFVDLVGTAVTDLIEDNPLSAAETAIALTGHAYTVLGKWLAIEDGTLVNSELVFEKSQTANEVVILDGTANEHALNVAMFNVAISRVILLDATIQRARLIVDNTYDADGSTLNYKLRATSLTGI